jgi:hypothetical protein
LEGGSLPPQPADLQATVWWKARVPDISAGGIGLLVKRPIPLGTELLVELSSGRPPAQLRALTARTVHATLQRNGDWLIGCKFSEQIDAFDVEVLLGNKL